MPWKRLPPGLRRGLLRALVLLGVLGLAEVGAGFVLEGLFPHLVRTRAYLRGDAQAVPRFQRCLPLPYLLYAPAPGWTGPGGPEHNAQGYRGPARPLARSAGRARVICLGGSTTYGWAVPRHEQAFPARLELALEAEPPAGWSGVEVLNGGLPFGTSAELLTHYLFKWRYYRPDLVVINTGGNDSQATIAPWYQPDYAHWRRQLEAPRPLAWPGRLLLRSRLLSLVLIPAFFGLDAGQDELTRPPGPPPIRWYPSDARNSRPVPPEDVAFLRNLRTLVDVIRADGAEVLLVPFRPAPEAVRRSQATQAALPPALLASLSIHEELLGQVARERQAPLAPFPAEVIGDGHWSDWCHLDAAGCQEKAAYLAPFVRQALAARASGGGR